MQVVEEPRTTVYEHLIPRDLAESLLERAELLSKKGRLNQSQRAFQKAAELFGEIESFLNVKDWEVEDQTVKERIAKIRDTASLKRKYCLARIS